MAPPYHPLVVPPTRLGLVWAGIDSRAVFAIPYFARPNIPSVGSGFADRLYSVLRYVVIHDSVAFSNRWLALTVVVTRINRCLVLPML